MKFDLPTISGLIALSLLIGSNIIWLLDKNSSNTKKKYAAERAFGHLEKNQLQLTSNLDNIFQNIQHRLDSIDKELIEIKYLHKKD